MMPQESYTLRDACDQDMDAITGLYNHYIRHTVITFEEVLINADEMLARLRAVQSAGLPWLVAEDDSRILGYAYAVPFRQRSAYRHTVESSVYLPPDVVGRGVGTRLYRSLLQRLAVAGVHAVIGGIALPNAGSVALHERVGFHKVAHLEQVGRKFEQWVDVGYWQIVLGESS